MEWALSWSRETHLDSDSHEGPAFGTDVAFFAAAAHVVVVCQIDIEYELPLHRSKGTWARPKSVSRSRRRMMVVAGGSPERGLDLLQEVEICYARPNSIANPPPNDHCGFPILHTPYSPLNCKSTTIWPLWLPHTPDPIPHTPHLIANPQPDGV